VADGAAGVACDGGPGYDRPDPPRVDRHRDDRAPAPPAHSIAGNVEVLFGLLVSPAITLTDYAGFLVLATLGNAFGGAVFVALLKYGHVVRGAE